MILDRIVKVLLGTEGMTQDFHKDKLVSEEELIKRWRKHFESVSN